MSGIINLLYKNSVIKYYLTTEKFSCKGLLDNSNKIKIMKASQPHYDSGKDYDLIDVGINYNLNFFRFNVLKYICRAGKKEDELLDLIKAKDYLEREINHLRSSRDETA